MEWHEESRKSEEFSLGVIEILKYENTEDIVVFGKIKGKIHNGDIVYLSNIGDDDDETRVTKILNLENGPNSAVDEASDCLVSIRLENGVSYNIKHGTVVHSKEQSIKEKQSSYVNALGDYYITNKKLELTDEEVESLSITDSAEIWRLFNWYCLKHGADFTEAEKENNKKKVSKIADALSKKIMSVNEIYCVFNKVTGEPHLFSKTIKKGEGYMCTPPDIRVISKAYKDIMSAFFPADKFEIKCIVNGEKKDGIYNFFGNTFYTNGACGVQILFENTAEDARILVKKNDYSNVKPENIPVTNPDLVRWMLLINQIEQEEGATKELNYRLYYNFVAKELLKARFLVPMKLNKDLVEYHEDGKAVIKPGNTIAIPTMKGKNDRQALVMYTDWNRLRKKYDGEWSSLVQTVEQAIEKYDCAINVTDMKNASGYISKEMFEKIKGSN